MRYVALFVLIAMTGCAAKKPQAQEIGEGHYTVAGESSSQASNAAALARRVAMKKASRFCRAKDHYLNWESFEDGSTDTRYTTTLTFSCR